MLEINLSEVVWAVINFLLLSVLLKWFLYDPTIAFLDARNAQTDASIQKEKELISLRQQQEERWRSQEKDALAEADCLLQQAKTEAERQTAQRLAEARENAARQKKQDREDAIRAGETERASLRETEAELARMFAARLLG